MLNLILPDSPPAVIGVGGRWGGGARRERCPARCAAYMCAVTPRNLPGNIFPLPSPLYAPYTAPARSTTAPAHSTRTAASLTRRTAPRAVRGALPPRCSRAAGAAARHRWRRENVVFLRLIHFAGSNRASCWILFGN